MDFPTTVGSQEFLFEGCRGRAATRNAARVHFMHGQFQDTVIIMEQGNPPHLLCPQCDMLVPWKELNGRDLTTDQCKKGADQKRRRLTAEKMTKSVAKAFCAYGRPLETAAQFKHLGRFLTALHYD